MEGNAERTELYYDGDCGVCCRIVERIRRSSRGGDFNFRNIRNGELPPGVSMAAAVQDIHAMERGLVSKGGDVLFVIAGHYPALRWSAYFRKLAAARAVARWGYRFFADHRPFFGRFI